MASERTKGLVTVMTYPHPSRVHNELVCTAGITESGEWARPRANGANFRFMHRIFLRTLLVASAGLVVVGCDQLSRLGLGPPPAASAPSTPLPAPITDIRPQAGTIYSDFAAGEGARYSPDQMGLNAIDRARLWRAVAVPTAGRLEDGGGAEALVFRGCAENGCDEGQAVVAIDTVTGAVFAAVSDAAGTEVLVPNDRVEALLRLNSPTRAWDDPAPRPDSIGGDR